MTATISAINSHARRFTSVANEMLRDSNLSWKAKGLLSYLLSHSEDFALTETYIINASSDGRAAVRSGLRELERLGYLLRHQTRDAEGRLGPSMYYVCDDPAMLLSVDRKPVDGFSVDGKSATKKEQYKEDQIKEYQEEEEEETRLRSEEDRASKEASPCQAPSPQDSNSDQPDTSSVDPESDREGQIDTRQEMERWIVAKLKNYWLATKDAHPSSEPLGVSCGAPVAKIAVMANVVTRSDARIFCLDVESRLEDYRLRGVEVRKAYGYLLDDLRERYEARIRGDEDEDTRRDPTSYEAQHAALEAAAEARRREAQELAESIEARHKQREEMLADDARRRERLCADDLPHFMSSIELEDKASWMRNAKPGAATNALWLDAIGEHIIRHIEDVHRVNADCAFVTGEMWEVMRRVAAMYTPALIDSEVVKLRGIDALDF